MTRTVALRLGSAIFAVSVSMATGLGFAADAGIGNIRVSFDATKWRATPDPAGTTLAFAHVEEGTDDAHVWIEARPRATLSCGVRGLERPFAGEASDWMRNAVISLRRVAPLSVYVMSGRSPCRNLRASSHRACVDHGGLMHVVKLEVLGCNGGPMFEYVHLFDGLVASLRPADPRGGKP